MSEVIKKSMEPGTFSGALDELKRGFKVCRKNWNGKGMYLYIAIQSLGFPPLPENRVWDHTAFPNSKFIVMKTADNKLIPWLASQTDLLAHDWIIVKEDR